MITEKIYVRAHVTLDCLLDAVGGPTAMCDYFANNLGKWAAREGYILLRYPKVFLSIPEPDSYWHVSGMLLVTVVGRGVKFTPIELAADAYVDLLSENLGQAIVTAAFDSLTPEQTQRIMDAVEKRFPAARMREAQ